MDVVERISLVDDTVVESGKMDERVCVDDGRSGSSSRSVVEKGVVEKCLMGVGEISGRKCGAAVMDQGSSALTLQMDGDVIVVCAGPEKIPRDGYSENCEPISSVLHGGECGSRVAPSADAAGRDVNDCEEMEIETNDTVEFRCSRPKNVEDMFGTFPLGSSDVDDESFIRLATTVCCDVSCVIFDGECAIHRNCNDAQKLFDAVVRHLLNEDETLEAELRRRTLMETDSTVDVPAGGADSIRPGFVPRAPDAQGGSTCDMLSAMGGSDKGSTYPSSRLRRQDAGPIMSTVAVALATRNGLQDSGSQDLSSTSSGRKEDCERTPWPGSVYNIRSVELTNGSQGLEDGNGCERVGEECCDEILCAPVNPDDSLRIANDNVLESHNEKARITATKTFDVSEETSAASVDVNGVVWCDGHSFLVKDAFVLYLISCGLSHSVLRGVALCLKTEEKARMWLEKVRKLEVKDQREKDAISRWRTEGEQLWNRLISTNAPKNSKRDGDLRPKVEHSGPLLVAEPQEVAIIGAIQQHQSSPSAQGNAVVIEQRPNGLLMRVLGQVNGKSVVVLNDSGADCSVVSLATAKRLGLSIRAMDKRISIQNPNGEPFTVCGKVCGKISFCHGLAEFPFSAMVLKELGSEMIVGDDFLRENQAVLTYGTGTVTYRNFDVPVMDRVTYSDTSYKKTDGTAVRMECDTLLRPNKRAEVKAKVILPMGFRYSQFVWIFEPLPAFMDLFGVGSVSSVVRLVDVDKIAAVVLSNCLFGEDIVIPEGTILGRLRTIRSLDDLMELPSNEDVNHDRGVLNNITIATKQPRESDDEQFLPQLKEILSELPPEVSATQRQQLSDVLYDFKHVLCSRKLGETSIFTFDIDMNGARPVCHKDRRYSPLELAAIQSQMKALLDAGLIEPASSAWASRLVCAPKKSADGQRSDIRVCVDFRDVNRLCVKDSYPAPNIEATMDMLKKAKWYSAFDLEKGYHQVPLSDRAKQVCAFRCPFGSFRYTRLPFGIMNAPAAFQRMMDVILRDLAWSCAMVYMDDVVVYSETWEDHLQHLRAVLERIDAANLTIKLSKSQFGKREISFLGYRVSGEGIRPDKSKVSAVLNFTEPESLSELRTFLGLTGVFRKFIPAYSDLARPLQKLTKKDAQGRWRDGTAWTTDCQLSFEALKEAVSHDIILAHPISGVPMKVVVDASGDGVGAMLAQEDDHGFERPIAFGSAVFQGAAKNYSATEKEGLAIVWAIKNFRPYIHGIPTIVVTDHAALTHIFSLGDPPDRIKRWLMDLAEFDLTFVHRKGSQNQVADALSRLRVVMDAAREVIDGGEMEEVKILRAVAVSGVNSTKKNVSVDFVAGIGDGNEPTSADTSQIIHMKTRKSEENRSKRKLSPSTAGSRQVRPRLSDLSGMEAPKDRVKNTDEEDEIVSLNGSSDDEVGGSQPNIRMQRVPKSWPPDGVEIVYKRVENPEWDGCPLSMSVDKFREAQLQDEEWRAMHAWLARGEKNADKKIVEWVEAQQEGYVLQGSILMKVEKATKLGIITLRLLTVIPTALRKELMSVYHSHPSVGGHMSGLKTLMRIKQNFWWPRICSDVLDFVRGCIVCSVGQHRTTPAAHIQPHTQAKYPFEFVAMDLLAMPTSKLGNSYACWWGWGHGGWG